MIPAVFHPSARRASLALFGALALHLHGAISIGQVILPSSTIPVKFTESLSGPLLESDASPWSLTFATYRFPIRLSSQIADAPTIATAEDGQSKNFHGWNLSSLPSSPFLTMAMNAQPLSLPKDEIDSIFPDDGANPLPEPSETLPPPLPPGLPDMEDRPMSPWVP
ncbi:hypothetical protein HNR46_001184 [Haloferula luteola]|uniref:Uncharacterized protein n=1 Tax=Haloferula luteola TaxID=595692 RepID=A0A840VAH9_9BACT|nr:hypothetical protein [Haloferula luteola]MBB5350950.1 hypothetical protein [Haloferula luteola]